MYFTMTAFLGAPNPGVPGSGQTGAQRERAQSDALRIRKRYMAPLLSELIHKRKENQWGGWVAMLE